MTATGTLRQPASCHLTAVLQADSSTHVPMGMIRPHSSAMGMKVLGGTKREPLSGLLSGDPTVRRAVLKNIFFRLPLRPQIKWVYYVFWRMAWMDGAPGMTYARLTYLYEYMISIKANCIDSTAKPEVVFSKEVDKLKKDGFKPKEQVTLEPYERDHAVVVGQYRV